MKFQEIQEANGIILIETSSKRSQFLADKQMLLIKILFFIFAGKSIGSNNSS